MSTSNSRPVHRRRAMAAGEWSEVHKDVTTSAALAGGGALQPAVLPEDDKPKEPTEGEPGKPLFKCEEHVEKCACQAKVGEPDKPVVKDAAPEAQQRLGVMIAFWVPADIAKSLAVADGTPIEEMHLTLGYFGKLGKDITEEQAGQVYQCAQTVARKYTELKGSIAGTGRFLGSETSDNKDVVYASVDVPGLSRFRHDLVDEIAKCSGVVKSEIHDYTPHITLKYVEADDDTAVKLKRQDIVFSRMVMVIGDKHKTITLGEADVAKFVPIVKSDDERRVTGVVLQPEVVDAQGDVYSEQVIKDAAHAFVARYNERNKIGIEHTVKAGSPVAMFPQGLHLVESYVAPVDLVINDKPVKKGSWIMTVFVEDDDTWEMVKGGVYRGFSIGGIAKIQRLTPVASAA